MCLRRPIRQSLGWMAIAVALLALPAPALARTLVPPKPNVFLGVSDGGTVGEFDEWVELTGKHPALLETFLPWGKKLNGPYKRWYKTATRPVLHLSTADGNTGAELLTPEQIALGDGDEYLLYLNEFFAQQGLLGYIRPLGEPNRCLNVWSGVECDGTLKGGEHSALWYKQAFRRISLIVRGNQSLEAIDATLAELALPPVEAAAPPTELPEAPVSIVWSPLPGGSPRVKGNFPGNYWPGRRWVDWVGTDFYSEYPVWKDLNHFLRGRQWQRMPVAMTEWAVSGEDDPRWVKRVIAWTVRHPRVRMLVYYEGFGPENPYDLRLYPRTTNTLRKKIRRPDFLATAEYNASTLQPPPPKPRKK